MAYLPQQSWLIEHIKGIFHILKLGPTFIKHWDKLKGSIHWLLDIIYLAAFWKLKGQAKEEIYRVQRGRWFPMATPGGNRWKRRMSCSLHFGNYRSLSLYTLQSTWGNGKCCEAETKAVTTSQIKKQPTFWLRSPERLKTHFVLHKNGMPKHTRLTGCHWAPFSGHAFFISSQMTFPPQFQSQESCFAHLFTCPEVCSWLHCWLVYEHHCGMPLVLQSFAVWLIHTTVPKIAHRLQWDKMTYTF